jgi:ABC-2 type transport system permease protein
VTWNWRAMRAIMRKDLQQVLQNKMVWLPMVIVPIIFLIVFPAMVVILPSLAPATALKTDDLTPLLRQLPAQLRKPLDGLNLQQQFTVLGANYLFAPMFLLIPLMVASILGADSFAGEKERKTLEGLLYTPVSDIEFFVAKVLTALVPAMVINLVSFLLYGLVVNLGGYHSVGHIFFPTATWWPLVFWMGPAVSIAGLGATVLMSSKAKTFMEAQQISGTLVLPIVFLMIGQVTGLFFLSIPLMLVIGLAIMGLGAWLIWIGARTFSRGELIAKI